jgi:hypothetical protein
MSVYVNIQGGLGNQMFQFAMGYALALRNNQPLWLDIRNLAQAVEDGGVKRIFELACFSPPAEVVEAKEMDARLQAGSSKLARLIGIGRINRIDETGFHYNPSYTRTPLPVYINGYFQSEKYFRDCAPAIRSVFLKNAWMAENDFWLNEIKTTSVSVAIHVRRGDYTANTEILKYHGICNATYYEMAVNKMLETHANARFFVFSDDITLAAKEIGHISGNIHFVEHNVPRITAYDMLLMSQCRHNIIANSTYSWWGAWLNENPDKIVIAPERWFADEAMQAQTGDLIPETWIRL